MLVAEEYFHGHLDWYNFDVDPPRDVLGEAPAHRAARRRDTLTMLPTQVTFNGMPNTRWWTFEDGRTNFGDIKPDTTDLAKLLLIEFGLVYANDWFLVPFTVPAGSDRQRPRHRGHQRLRRADLGRGRRPRRRRRLAAMGDVPALASKARGTSPPTLSLVIPPAAQKVLEGRPLEEVHARARRDGQHGLGRRDARSRCHPASRRHGREAADETRAFYERISSGASAHRRSRLPPAEGAKIRYKVMSSVPENWIPMIPVHVDRRQPRSAAPARRHAAHHRWLIETPSATPQPCGPARSLAPRPRSRPSDRLLPPRRRSAAGRRARDRSFQRTRWRDGRAWVWLGVRKQTGRGEGSSGLAFDRIVDIKPSEGKF